MRAPEANGGSKKAAEAALSINPQPASALAAANGRSGGRLARVFLTELLDAAGGVHNLLLARIEGMASGADFDL